MKKIIVLLLIILNFTSNSNLSICGTIDPNKQDIIHTKYAEKFDCVGNLCGRYSNDSLFCASAVAISDRWIVTAAHVVSDATKSYITINKKKINIEKFVFIKEFDQNKIGLNDIAIGYCAESIGLSEYPELYSDADEVNKVSDICGFGFTGTFVSGATRFDSKKRAGTNRINSIFKHTLVCDSSLPKDPKCTAKEFLIASGDSGGGLFIDNKLAGINSFVMSTDDEPNSSYGDESCHTRISIFRDWILQTLKDE